jgi:hypothetical protein
MGHTGWAKKQFKIMTVLKSHESHASVANLFDGFDFIV